MININLDEFLEFVGQEESDFRTDSVTDIIDEYLKESMCPQCGSKLKEKKDVWSKTGFWILEYNTVCKKCGYIIEMKDNRERVREQYLIGNVRVRDVESLKQELGLE